MQTSEFTGRVIQKKGSKYISKKDGSEAMKYDLVLEDKNDNYSDYIAVSAFGEKAEAVKGVGEGDLIKIRYAINCHDYQGKWFTSLNLLSHEMLEPHVINQLKEQCGLDEVKSEPKQTTLAAGDDGLPF